MNLENWFNWVPGQEEGTIPLSVWPSGDDDRRNEYTLTEIDYRSFRQAYQAGTSIDHAGMPQAFSIDTADRLVVWPAPDQDYRISGTYLRSPQVLAADGDVPIVAAQFHNAITWTAVQLFHEVDEADPSAIISANLKVTDRMAALRRRYLPVRDGFAYRPLGGGRTGSIRQQSSRGPT